LNRCNYKTLTHIRKCIGFVSHSNVPRMASETPNLAGLVRFQGDVPIFHLGHMGASRRPAISPHVFFLSVVNKSLITEYLAGIFGEPLWVQEQEGTINPMLVVNVLSETHQTAPPNINPRRQ